VDNLKRSIQYLCGFQACFTWY